MPSDSLFDELGRVLAPARNYLDLNVRRIKVAPWMIGDHTSLDRDELTGLHHAIAVLANHDALPGQPLTTTDGARQALAGRSTRDPSFWADLQNLAHVLLVSDDHVLVGACAIGTTSSNKIVVPWMHAGENPGLLARLVDLVQYRAAGRPVSFFGFGGPVGQGLEGSPRQQRPYTHKIITQAGYTPHEDWGFWTNPGITDGPWLDDIDVAETTVQKDPDGYPTHIQFKINGPASDDGGAETAGEAELTIAPRPIAELRWLHITPELRGHGFGRRLLHQALREAVNQNCEQACLQVDDDDPAERDREPAKRLYFTSGFREIDRLINYTKP